MNSLSEVAVATLQNIAKWHMPRREVNPAIFRSLARKGLIIVEERDEEEFIVLTGAGRKALSQQQQEEETMNDAKDTIGTTHELETGSAIGLETDSAIGYELETGVPVPVAIRAVSRGSKYPFSSMAIGDSFLVPVTEEDPDVDKIMKRMSGACANAQRASRDRGFPKRFIKRPAYNDAGGVTGVRVWRTE